MEKGDTFGHRRVLVFIIVVASFMVLVFQSAGPCAGKVSGNSAKQSNPSSNHLVTPSSSYCNAGVTSTFTVVNNTKGSTTSARTQPVVRPLLPSLMQLAKALFINPKYRQTTR